MKFYRHTFYINQLLCRYICENLFFFYLIFHDKINQKDDAIGAPKIWWSLGRSKVSWWREDASSRVEQDGCGIHWSSIAIRTSGDGTWSQKRYCNRYNPLWIQDTTNIEFFSLQTNLANFKFLTSLGFGAALPRLTAEQQTAVQKAKKYAMEQSIKMVLMK